jgi:hypothetical protein
MLPQKYRDTTELVKRNTVTITTNTKTQYPYNILGILSLNDLGYRTLIVCERSQLI